MLGGTLLVPCAWWRGVAWEKEGVVKQQQHLTPPLHGGCAGLVAALGSGAEEEPGVSRMMEEHGVPTLVV